jgi:hypothetical protein
MQKKPVVLIAKIRAEMTVTGSYQSVPGLILPNIEDEGWYNITDSVHQLTAADNNDIVCQFAIDGVKVISSTHYMNQVTSKGINHAGKSMKVYLRGGDNVSVQAKGTNGASKIYFSSPDFEGFIRAEKCA